MPASAKKTAKTAKTAAPKRAKTNQRRTSHGILSRIEVFAAHAQLSIMEVERLCGIPKGTLNGIKFRQKTNPGIDATLYAPAILKSFSAISARWLLLGEDSMLEPGAFDHVTRGDKNFFKALLTALHERSRRMITSMEEFQDEITALINAI